MRLFGGSLSARLGDMARSWEDWQEVIQPMLEGINR